MRKYSMHFFTFILIIAMAAPAHAYKVKTFKPLAVNPMAINPLAVPYNTPAINESYPKITQVESILFRKTYEKENIYNRLNRIESKLFRRQFQNMPLSSRMDNILANIDEGQMYGISSKELSKLEIKILCRTY